jgi:hypothetical protein
MENADEKEEVVLVPRGFAVPENLEKQIDNQCEDVDVHDNQAAHKLQFEVQRDVEPERAVQEGTRQPAPPLRSMEQATPTMAYWIPFDNQSDEDDEVEPEDHGVQSSSSLIDLTPEVANMVSCLTKLEKEVRDLSKISDKEFAAKNDSVNTELLIEMLCRLEVLFWNLGIPYVDARGYVAAARPSLVMFVARECSEEVLDSPHKNLATWDSDMISSFSRMLANRFFKLARGALSL